MQDDDIESKSSMMRLRAAQSMAILLGLYLPALQASPAPLSRQNACPSGYHVSGGYCVPNSDKARAAIEKNGACPSGYFISGDYCLGGQNAKPVMHKQGACPAGWFASGNYCLKSN